MVSLTLTKMDTEVLEKDSNHLKAESQQINKHEIY